MSLARPIFALSLLLTAAYGQTAQNSELKTQIQSRSERLMIDETTAAGEAQAKAQSRSAFGMELRPSVTDSEVGIALRIYLPDRWSKNELREQLILVAESEQLRVSALEWAELLDVYRDFCDYRMLHAQLDLFNQELAWLHPYLEKANRSVELNELAVIDRAKLFSLYLDLVNSHEKVRKNLLKTELDLRLMLGADAHLAKFAQTAVLRMPKETQLNALIQHALENRSDYKQVELEYRALQSAEKVARSEDGFRLKYIQPFYDVDYTGGDNTIGLSASFILPVGTRNPDIALYQKEQLLAHSCMDRQRSLIKHRLSVFLQSADALRLQANERNARIAPLLQRLKQDMQTMNTGRLEDLRDLMLVRERMLDVSLESSSSQCQQEKIAVDLANELGSLTN